MNLDQLRAELDRLGVAPSRYSLTGGTPDDGFGIKRQGRRWLVYYSERGNRYPIGKYDTEDNACRTLLARLIDDPNQRGDPEAKPRRA